MEDGGELEGTFECSNRAAERARKAAAASTSAAAAAARGSAAPRDDPIATGSGGGMRRAGDKPPTPPRDQSPLPWEGAGGKEISTDKWRGVAAESGRVGDGSGYLREDTPPPQVSALKHAPAGLLNGVSGGGGSGSGGGGESAADIGSASAGLNGKVNRPLTALAGGTGSAGATSGGGGSPPATEPLSIIKHALPSTAGAAFRKIPQQAKPGGASSANSSSASAATPAASDGGSSSTGGFSIMGGSPSGLRSVRAPSPVGSAGLQVLRAKGGRGWGLCRWTREEPVIQNFLCANVNVDLQDVDCVRRSQSSHHSTCVSNCLVFFAPGCAHDFPRHWFC